LLYRFSAIAVFTCIAAAGAPPPSRLEKVRVSPTHLRDDIRFLSSPELRGRASGSEGLTAAARYIAAAFAAAGVRPVHGGSYFQSFTITADATAGSENRLVSTGCGTDDPFVPMKDFVPLNFSSSGTVAAGLVFAGYGITAPEYGYDDYQGIDARGKIAIVLRHEPQEYEPSSVFEGRVYSEHSQLFRKALNAREHGAAAVLIVNDTANHSGGDTLEPVTSLASPGSAGIPFVQVRSELVDKWFASAGRNFAEVQTSIDHESRPASFGFPETMRVTLNADIRSRQKPVANVVAYLPGESAEYLIVGAHYDHLGLGEQYSMAPDQSGTIHPGADDNASGTAGVIALARFFAAQPKMKRGVLFIAFAGEEIGLLGSSYYTSAPLLPLRDAAAMINLDMVGRLREHKLIIGGTSSGEGMRAMVDAAGKRAGLELQTDDLAVYGSSDHTTFKARSIPVLFFFTGLHADYHRPTDTADRIDPKATAQVIDLAGAVAAELAQRPGRIAFVGGRPHPPARAQINAADGVDTAR
jgi:hypothetical protein